MLGWRERSGWQKAVAALANKNARILWAVMSRAEAFDADHLSTKPDSADAVVPGPSPVAVPA